MYSGSYWPFCVIAEGLKGIGSSLPVGGGGGMGGPGGFVGGSKYLQALLYMCSQLLQGLYRGDMANINGC